MDLRPQWVVEQALGQDDHRDVADRVNKPRRAEPAVPAVGARVRAFGDDRLAEPPPAAIEKAVASPGLLLRRQLVPGHLLDRIARQYRVAAPEQHASEREEVING